MVQFFVPGSDDVHRDARTFSQFDVRLFVRSVLGEDKAMHASQLCARRDEARRNVEEKSRRQLRNRIAPSPFGHLMAQACLAFAEQLDKQQRRQSLGSHYLAFVACDHSMNCLNSRS